MIPGLSHPPRTHRWLTGLTRALLWLVTGAWLVFALSWGALHWVIVPRIVESRADLESLATRVLGVQVRVGAVQARNDGAMPVLTLQDVRLYDAQGRQALHLPHVTGALSVRSLWHLGFSQLVIERPVVDARRTGDGRIEVAGFEVATQDKAGSPLADWFFSQAEIVIRQGEVRWTDEQRPQAPTIALQSVDFVARNPGRQHLWRLDASPPAEWGRRFHLKGQFQQPLWQPDASRWRDWKGTLFAELEYIDVSRVQLHLDTQHWLGLELQEGRGALRAWVDLADGQLQSATSDVAIAAVSMRLAPSPDVLALEQLSGRFHFQRGRGFVDMSTEKLAFQMPSGLVWPGGNVRYRQSLDEKGAQVGVLLQADRLDLGTLRQLSSQWALDPVWRTRLDEWQPAGLIESLHVEWKQGQAHGWGLPSGQWRAQGTVRRLSLQAEAVSDSRLPDGSTHTPLGRPGVSGMDLVFDARPNGGTATVSLNQGNLEFPGVFEDPQMGFDELNGQLSWQIRDDGIELEIPKLRLRNDDAKGEVSVHWQTGPSTAGNRSTALPGRLSLRATLDEADGARVHRYLPLDIDAETRHYVRDSVRSGRTEKAQFVVEGDLNDFPFDRPGSGTFDIRARLRDIDFDYVPPSLSGPEARRWPALERLNADLHIDRVSLRIDKGQAHAAGLPQLRATEIDAAIPDFTTDGPRLKVKAKVNGPGSDAVGFVNRSPLADLTGGVFENARVSGPLAIRFDFDMPLMNTEATRIEGDVRLVNNEVRFSVDTPQMSAVNTTVTFSDKGFDVRQARARMLGGDLRFSGGMGDRGTPKAVRFQGQGTASGEGLRQALAAAGVALAGTPLSGTATYNARLEFLPTGTALRIDSTLQGLGLALPPPFNKSAVQLLPLRIDLTPLPVVAASTSKRDRLQLELGTGLQPLLAATYEREHDGSTTRVLRGTLGVRSERLELPAQGVHAQINLPEFDVDAWDRSLESPAPGSASSASAHNDTMRTYWPTQMGLFIGRLSQGGRDFHQIVAGGSREQDNWRLTLQAKELEGYLDYRPRADRTPARLFARLSRLTIPASRTQDVERLLEDSAQHMPALDVEVRDLEMLGRKLGRLEIEAVHRSTGSGRNAAREWQLNKLNLTVPEARLQTTGSWAATRPSTEGRKTQLALRLDIEDAGALLGRFGMPGVVRGGKGHIQGSLNWRGSPMSLHYPSLGGELAIDVTKGQFLQAEPGLAKLLGVLSLQALPRRLTLDFRDVFSEGFAFDQVRGNARIEQGIATTNNLQMKGVSAAVLLEGSANISLETQDIHAVVIPELNTGTASLVATMINPVTGLGTFLAQYLLRNPLQAAATQEFHITGPWADPRVEKMNRRTINNATPTINPER